MLKWGFVLLTAYTGPIGAFLYVLGCREPLPGLHEQYVAVRWRQALGSTMHCVAGDGLGILIGAVIGSELRMSPPEHLALEYVLGFGVGWTIFQALFMRDMAGGSYSRALRQTFIPEFLSMNALMAGMVPVNWWLVANHLKHGMMTVRRAASGSHAEHTIGQKIEMQMPRPSVGAIIGMAVLSIAMFGIGIGISAIVVDHR